MNKSLFFKQSTGFLLLLITFVSCGKKDPFFDADKHLREKIEYIQAKGRMLAAENSKTLKVKSEEPMILTTIVDVKSIFPKVKPMPEPWAAMITFSMVHMQERTEIMRENFRVIFEFESPYWVPAKMENEQFWRKTGQHTPWKEITKESNKDGWDMINSLLGLNGP